MQFRNKDVTVSTNPDRNEFVESGKRQAWAKQLAHASETPSFQGQQKGSRGMGCQEKEEEEKKIFFKSSTLVFFVNS